LPRRALHVLIAYVPALISGLTRESWVFALDLDEQILPALRLSRA
jgi:hypothetical protein